MSATRWRPLRNSFRFLVGGIGVSAFAVLGDVLRPKSFAGLFGAVPSVALATLSLALWKEGGDYVSIDGRSMMLGALALAAYAPDPPITRSVGAPNCGLFLSKQLARREVYEVQSRTRGGRAGAAAMSPLRRREA